MKPVTFILLAVLVLLSFTTCGRRTAPVPYESPEYALPRVNVSKPVFRGDNLYISWSIDKVQLDATADTFYISVYEQKSTCPICDQNPIERISIKKENGWAMRFQQVQHPLTSIGFFESDAAYSLSINNGIVRSWKEKGLFYLTVAYRIESGIISQQSEKAWPTWPGHIPQPKIDILKKTELETNQLDLILKWQLVTEFVYRNLEENQISMEKTKYYGLKLYQVLQGEGDRLESTLNDQPLTSGQISIAIRNILLYAVYVDRHGNESNRILIIDNTHSTNSREEP